MGAKTPQLVAALGILDFGCFVALAAIVGQVAGESLRLASTWTTAVMPLQIFDLSHGYPGHFGEGSAWVSQV